MVGEEGSAAEHAPRNDSSSVVLQARWTVFLMLIASTLVAVGVLAEDDTRLNRALQGAEVVTGLMSLWHPMVSEMAWGVVAVVVTTRHDHS